MENLDAFARQVAAMVRPEWQLIPNPSSDEWKQSFNKAVYEYLRGDVECCDYNSHYEGEVQPLPSIDLSHLSQKEKYDLSCRVLAMMDGLWLKGRKKIEAIELSRRSNALDFDEVVAYAQRLRGTTYSPPENVNVHDPTRHCEMFPQYHFLGMPLINEMHASRLFALSKLTQQSSSPKVIFEPVSEDMHRMRIECATAGAVIYYQTSRVNTEQINPHTSQPTVYTTAPAVYDASRKFNFKTSSNQFIVYAWSTCEGLRQSEVVRVEYNPPSSEGTAAPAKKSFGFFLGKEKKR